MPAARLRIGRKNATGRTASNHGYGGAPQAENPFSSVPAISWAGGDVPPLRCTERRDNRLAETVTAMDDRSPVRAATGAGMQAFAYPQLNSTTNTPLSHRQPFAASGAFGVFKPTRTSSALRQHGC